VIAKQKTISISSKIESIDRAVSEAVNFATDIGVSADALFGIDMAVREVIANAVKHGNKLDERKPVEIRLSATDEGFEVLIRDFGDGFEVETVPDPTDPENLLKANGRGILFMRTFMDKVEWMKHEDGGMLVKMVKIC
jgi:serine/threonine-protein kinase RsbW